MSLNQMSFFEFIQKKIPSYFKSFLELSLGKLKISIKFKKFRFENFDEFNWKAF